MMERTKYFKAAKMDYREELLYPINQPKAIGDSHPEKKCSCQSDLQPVGSATWSAAD